VRQFTEQGLASSAEKACCAAAFETLPGRASTTGCARRTRPECPLEAAAAMKGKRRPEASALRDQVAGQATRLFTPRKAKCSGCVRRRLFPARNGGHQLDALREPAVQRLESACLAAAAHEVAA